MEKKFSIVILVIFILANFYLPNAWSDEGTSGDYMRGIGTKFGRGLWNVITSPAEIPCTTASDMKDRQPAAGFFTGFGKGVVFMLRRILVGVDEVGTFVIPMEATLPPVCQTSQPK